MARTYLGALALALLLGACTDPFTRPGTWHPEGANEANLRAMVADPGDLARGVDEPGEAAQLPAAAIARLRTDKVKPLPDTSIAKVGPTGSTTSGGS